MQGKKFNRVQSSHANSIFFSICLKARKASYFKVIIDFYFSPVKKRNVIHSG